MTRIISILALALSVAPVSVAQESPADASHLTPELVINEARAAYQSGPLAENLTIRLTSSTSHTRSASLLLRLNAHQPDNPPVFRLEFDALLVSAAGGSLAAAHTDNENDRWIVPEAGSDLATILAHLPPLPIPQLHLAFDSSSRFDEPTPYTTGVVWESAEPDPPRPFNNRSEVQLHGRSSSGVVQAVFDAATFRLNSFHAELADGFSLDITAEPADPGDPPSWPINTTGRHIVASLSDLAPQRGPILPGDYLPDLAFTEPDGVTPWSLHAALAALPPAPPDGPALAVALIAFRFSDDPVELAAAEASARLALRAVQLVSPSATLDTHVTAAIDLKYGDQVPALKQRWGTEGSGGIPGWTTPSGIIDRFDPKARAILILAAPDRRLLAVLPLDGQTDPAPIAEQILGALGTPKPPGE